MIWITARSLEASKSRARIIPAGTLSVKTRQPGGERDHRIQPSEGTRSLEGKPPWQDPQWLAAADGWIDAECARAGLTRIGPAWGRGRPYSVVARVPTASGTVWFKANPPAARFEPALMVALADWHPDRFIARVVRGTGRPWPAGQPRPCGRAPGKHLRRSLSLALRIAPLARALTWGRLSPCYLGHPAPSIHAARALAGLLDTDPLGLD
jgi:hypothetical protein